MVCPKCGGQMNENQACPYCGYSAGYTPVNPAQPQNPYQPTYYNPAESAFAPKENMLLGIVGALIGSLLGVASIVLFFQMDMVASLSGLILAFCTLKGYEMLGKKLGNIGIIICILIMLAVYCQRGKKANLRNYYSPTLNLLLVPANGSALIILMPAIAPLIFLNC